MRRPRGKEDFHMWLPKPMVTALEKETKKRFLSSIQETIRQLLSEALMDEL